MFSDQISLGNASVQQVMQVSWLNDFLMACVTFEPAQMDLATNTSYQAGGSRNWADI